MASAFPGPEHRLVILDDDPTGIQAVHGCLALTVWDQETLKAALRDREPYFFILTNTRALTAGETVKRISEVTAAVQKAAGNLRLSFLIRSDSTLRGHFPREMETVLTQTNQKVHARFFVPAFFEGGRVTEGNVHYLLRDGERIACHQTEFAHDSVFGYSTASLPEYIEEKTSGAVAAGRVLNISTTLLEPGHSQDLQSFLGSLNSGRHVVVNAVNYTQLNNFAGAVRAAAGEGKHFIFQSAASLVKSLTACPDTEYVTSHGTRGPGLIVVGSHVGKTTRQLNNLLSAGTGLAAIEADAAGILADTGTYIAEILGRMKDIAASENTPLIFTTRSEMPFRTAQERQNAGMTISTFLSDLVARCPYTPSFCIAKGGITSHEVLAHGLGVASARVLGQAAAGVPVIEMPESHRWAGMTYIIFPGNVGDDDTLTRVYLNLRGES